MHRIIEELRYEVELLKTLIHKLLKNHNKPIFTLSIYVNNQTYIMADIVLNLGVSKTGNFVLIDNKTGNPLTGVVFSAQTLGTNSAPQFATFSLVQVDPNDPASFNAVSANPLAAGSGTIVISCHAAYTDPGDNSAQSQDFSVTKNFTVTASPDGVSFDVAFS